MSRDRAIEEIIRRAMEEGKFDNLPGKGKPLNLDENPHIDPAWQLAYKMLAQHGFAPEWIETRQQIEEELAAARQALARSWQWRQANAAGPLAPQEWEQAQTRFKETAEALNKRIRDYNLTIPADAFYRPLIDIGREIARASTPA